MKKFSNALEIFTILNKSNCRECRFPTCMAFAGAVFTGAAKLLNCPHIPPEVLQEYGDISGESAISENIDRAMQQLKEEIVKCDLARVAGRIGGFYQRGKLTLKVLGKNFSISDNGDITTDIHVNPWVALPVYSYILRGGGDREPGGRWVSLRELPSGRDWFRLFGQRCEKPLKKIADRHPELFEDMIRLFSGRRGNTHCGSDVSVVLHPLPRVPMLICYWHPENELASELNLFFDETAEDYLDLNSINSLGTGFVTMLEKLVLRHGLVG